MPPAVIPREIATPSLLAFIITSKYVDGMPLKRQETSFARIGVDLPRQRMADWIMAVGEALETELADMAWHGMTSLSLPGRLGFSLSWKN